MLNYKAKIEDVYNNFPICSSSQIANAKNHIFDILRMSDAVMASEPQDKREKAFALI